MLMTISAWMPQQMCSVMRVCLAYTFLATKSVGHVAIRHQSLFLRTQYSGFLDSFSLSNSCYAGSNSSLEFLILKGSLICLRPESCMTMEHWAASPFAT